MLNSANIFFKRRFVRVAYAAFGHGPPKPSIAFICETIEASIPPYLARHLMGWTALPPFGQGMPAYQTITPNKRNEESNYEY